MKQACKHMVAISSLAALLCASNGAQAQNGFLGGIIDQFAPGVGTVLDQANDRLGNPVDHGFAAAVDTVAPGAGSVLEAGWALQRSGALNGGSASPGGANAQMAPIPAFGNVCFTPAGNYPGPFNPLGMPCQAMTPYGIVFGSVGR
jgi:hypothetical protein